MDLEDDAKFQCQIGAADGVKPIRSRYATLTVLVPPEPPQLMPKGEVFKTVEGGQVELRCESRGGKPASEVSPNFRTHWGSIYCKVPEIQLKLRLKDFGWLIFKI